MPYIDKNIRKSRNNQPTSGKNWPKKQTKNIEKLVSLKLAKTFDDLLNLRKKLFLAL